MREVWSHVAVIHSVVRRDSWSKLCRERLCRESHPLNLGGEQGGYDGSKNSSGTGGSGSGIGIWNTMARTC
ncbi:hypothetical protein FIBSPDRAFT_63558 [Athelia psychrophila]|uniref:Uncharacterized protein n=1 Tax=Athelia psychrophila TaxID=1759441 RepID=A0A166EYP2_9AGAM|nr:hypothetical protein FIBSPDRAFT_63558 [Fibularhizoctonia sp. CBS 109695]